ncbi:CENP-B N-terminal DNA-binding domain [Popillia japonica]|uniref:CENP-B N-terminal DNA-binding domain n=1 Tax=Popillia japonica TaxID=7064 RepID=A0AAW1GJ38_POPJA
MENAQERRKIRTSKKYSELKTKVQIIQQAEGGCRVADIARRFNMSWSTVRDIIKGKERYRNIAKETDGSMRVVKLRNTNLVTIETRLLKWLKKKRVEDLI